METARRRFQKIRGRYCCHRRRRGRHQSRVVPGGGFTVCVGPKKERFVINIEHANHPRFLSLLQDADNNEYGSPIHNNGPICLPCDVHVFSETLTEMEKEAHFHSSFPIVPRHLISLIRRLCFTCKL